MASQWESSSQYPGPVAGYDIRETTRRCMGDTDHRLSVVEVATGRVVLSWTDHPPDGIAFARDGTRVFVQKRVFGKHVCLVHALPSGERLDEPGRPNKKDVILAYGARGSRGREPFRYRERPSEKAKRIRPHDAMAGIEAGSPSAGRGFVAIRQAWFEALSPLEGIETLPEGFIDRALRSLDRWPAKERVNPYWLDWTAPPDLWRLIDHAVFPSHYRLGELRVKDEGAKALAAATHMPPITDLSLCDQGIGDEGASMLAGAPQLRGLKRLKLSTNAISDEGARALAGSPYLEALEELNLYENLIGDEGVEAFARSTTLGSLMKLNLYDNPIGRRGREAWKASELRVRVNLPRD